MKIVTILGARPQFIKASSVSRAIKQKQDIGVNINEIIVHTGQHYDFNMSDVFFDEMKIPKPNYFLGIGGKTHGSMTGQMIEKIEEVLVKEKPDWVMVYGDTNSTLSGAIAAAKMQIKIAHVEAGLRSFNMTMPEEINRILTDRISSLLLCPTQEAIINLNNEGVRDWKTKARVYLVGDVMQDGALFYKNLAKKPLNLNVSDNFILCTIHRAENTDDKIRIGNIITALNEIAQNQQVIMPLHPRTKKILQKNFYDISNLTIIDPVGYLNMIWLINNCSIVMTDSGGLQKEAYFFAKPCITLREETEWVELVNSGFNVLVGSNRDKILNAYENQTKIKINNSDLNLYGSGKASHQILMKLVDG